MVNLGPQLVQLMNGYPNRRSAGSASSCRQSAQVAVSADTRVRRRPALPGPVGPSGPAGLVGPVGPAGPAGSLAAMAKDADRLGAIAFVVTRSILASGGASRSSRRRNSLTAATGPSTSTNTPSRSLPTCPTRPSPVARVYTNGRKPTPWTTPSTRTAVRISPLTRGSPSAQHLPLGQELRARAPAVVPSDQASCRSAARASRSKSGSGGDHSTAAASVSADAVDASSGLAASIGNASARVRA